jgi:hypothetical protein
MDEVWSLRMEFVKGWQQARPADHPAAVRFAIAARNFCGFTVGTGLGA